MNIIKFEIKKNIKSILIWSIIISFVLLLFMSIFPSMKDSAMQDLVNAKMDSLPTVMLEMFNIAEMPNFSNIIEYFAYSFQFILMAIAIYGAILGAGCLSLEENEGTIEFLYSKPITRGEIILKKVISCVISFYMFVFIIGVVSISTIIIFSGDKNNILDNIMKVKEMYLGVIIVGSVFVALGLLSSVLMKKSKSSVQVGLGIFFGTYILGIISKLKESLSFLSNLSPYEKFIPSEIARNGIDIKYAIIIIFIIVISLFITTKLYKKRDFNI